MDTIKIPQSSDDPQYILIYPWPDLVPMVAAAVIGIAIEQVTLCLLATIVLLGRYQRFRDGKPKMFVPHWLYGKGIGMPRGHTIPEPMDKVFLP
ncbi:type IV conjugative transfer system protein TraL [Thalassospira sp. CH_XMU1420-2]|uniref:type IV conjugative transfer system protein TraL n=1 Tax=Thalassospira sp. CH_XMU1420-2 TaxID=3107769 RepID=UPI00300ACEDB